MQGDWRKHHEANKELLYVIEPVIESLIQLLVQSILLYVVLGPSDSVGGLKGRHIAHSLRCIWVAKYIVTKYSTGCIWRINFTLKQIQDKFNQTCKICNWFMRYILTLSFSPVHD